jgi:hypothetical protein
MRTLIRCSALAALLALVAIPAASPARVSGGPEAHAARSCPLSARTQRHLGTTYVLKVGVRGASCRGAKRLVRAYHACRHDNGGADGRCGSVSGYHCSERRFDKSRFSFDARMTCTRGSYKKVTQTYSQNL